MSVKVSIPGKKDVEVAQGTSYEVNALQILHVLEGDKRVASFRTWDSVSVIPTEPETKPHIVVELKGDPAHFVQRMTSQLTLHNLARA